MIKRAYILAIALVFAVSAIAGAATWKAEAEHSNIGFKVKHLMISNVYGSFHDFDVTVEYDEINPGEATINVTINTESVDTDNEKRDGHLKSADFFDVENFPNISFASSKIKKSGDNYEIHGHLTIRGITKEVVLDTELTPVITDPWGNTRIGGVATTKINRTDFGLVWNKSLETGGLLVSNDVNITIEVELIKQTQTAMK